MTWQQGELAAAKISTNARVCNGGSQHMTCTSNQPAAREQHTQRHIHEMC